MSTTLSFLLDENGMTVPTLSEVNAYLTARYQTIYGTDIDLSSSSPDGQMMNIISQTIVDMCGLLKQVYTSMDPDQAVGNVLDQRVSVNGIQRQQGTYTTTPISLVLSQSVTLYGLDQTTQDVYTVADNSGNQWQLVTTQTPSTAGTYSYIFRAENTGRIVTIPNTITVPVTIVLGVTSVNNPTAYTTLGVDEETDAALKLRRQKSISAKSGGFYNALYSALNNLSGMVSAIPYENDTNEEDTNGVPPHSLWVIVDGNASDLDIATAIYSNRTLGCGMKGTSLYNVTQADGTTFTIYWDEVAEQEVFIRFDVASIDGINPPNVAGIIEQLPALFVPGVSQKLDVGELVTYVRQIDPNAIMAGQGFSDTETGVLQNVISPTDIAHKFVVQSQNIYVLPMVMAPSTAKVSAGSTQQFTAYGGSQSFVYSISTNVSGGTIDATTGLYTAGTTLGTDVIRATDEDSNYATSTVNVT